VLTARAREVTRDMVTPVALALGRLGLSPDALTVVGTVLHVGVAWLLASGRPLWWGALALAAAASFDALDGALARASERTSPFGAFLDSTLDRISEILLFLGLLMRALSTADSVLAVATLVALAGSLMVSYTRARSEGIGFDTRIGVFGRLERMMILVVGLAVAAPVLTVVVVAVGAWFTVAQRVVDVRRQCLRAGATGARAGAGQGDGGRMAPSAADSRQDGS